MNDVARPPPLRIDKVSIKGLFGLYDHTIQLHLDERVTIIHGPNGVGKTKLLSWVDALFRLDFSVFEGVPFEKFTVEFTDDTLLEIQPTDSMAHSGHFVSFIVRVGNAEEWKHKHTVDDPYDDYVELVADGPPPPPKPTWLRKLVNRIPVYFVQTQRLLKRQDPKLDDRRGAHEIDFTPTVRNYSDDLQRRIQGKLADYARTSQNLDQAFPQKLIQHGPTDLDIEDLKQRMRDLDRTRERLTTLGLLRDNDPSHPFDVRTLDGLEDEKRTALSLYVENTEAKLHTLEDLAYRIELFLDNINSKFNNKELSIDPSRGIIVTNDNDVTVNLGDLSSAEEHELVLLYDLLFNVHPGTLVLIDEPELSLHITWQKRFLDDLPKVTAIAGLDALVATHSPFIIGEHEGLMVSLAAAPADRVAS